MQPVTPDPLPGASAPLGPGRNLPERSGVARRTVLAGFGTAALLASAGCNPFSSAPTTRTVVMEAPPPIDPMVNLIATTRLHLLRLETAVAKGGELAATLTPLRDDRKAHLKALEAELARTTPKPSGSSTSPAKPAAPGSVTLPADAEAIVAAIRGDAATAQLQFTDAITIVARYRAAILGTVAASLATHRSVLA